jgi:CubicO group peptidase (beta-lactamase class C family)
MSFLQFLLSSTGSDLFLEARMRTARSHRVFGAHIATTQGRVGVFAFARPRQRGRRLHAAGWVGLLACSLALPAVADFSVRTRSIGHSSNLGAIDANATVSVPAADAYAPIVGIGIAGSSDETFVWYADGQVSSGNTLNFEYHSGKVDFSLPEGKDPWDILAMAINGTNDNVVTYYSDGTASVGWSQDLAFYAEPAPVTLPAGKELGDLVGVGSAGSNGHFYFWFADGTATEGNAFDMAFYRTPYAYSLPGNKKYGQIIDIAIAGSTDLVYSWYHDVERGLGHPSLVEHVDARSMDLLRRYRLPGLGVAVSKDGRVVLEKGYGYRNLTTGSRMGRGTRGRIGSVSKVITALSAMHLAEADPDFSVHELVYANTGPLPAGIYDTRQNQGVTRHQPIVAKAIALNDQVYTWNHNGTVSSGTSLDPDAYSGPRSYSLPSGMTPEDIRAIAISPQGRVITWYDNGTWSEGRSWDLDHFVEPNEDDKVSLPPDYSMSHVVGIGIAKTGRVHIWYDDGYTSAGTVTDFDADISPRTYSVAPGKSRYAIRAMAIAKSNDTVYTWLADGTRIKGSSRNLDSKGGPKNYAVPGYAYDPGKNWNHWYDGIRVDHLMSHSSGLSRSGDVVGAERMFGLSADSLNYRQVHEYMLRTRKLGFEAGTDERYSNHGMGLVGHIVAEVSGMPFRDYARANIIDPLGLAIRADSTGQGSTDMYRHDYDDGIPVAYVDDNTNDLGLAAGGWKASAGDLVRLMLGTDQDASHPDLLAPATLDLMESRPYPTPAATRTAGIATTRASSCTAGAWVEARPTLPSFQRVILARARRRSRSR